MDLSLPIQPAPLELSGELLTARARERVGTVLRQKWRVDSLLGVGGFGAVFSATHRTGSVVAVKVLHQHLAFNDEVRGRFLREGYVANRIRHPGVVTVLDDDTDEGGVPFLIMELLEGVTLEQRMRTLDGKMDPREALWIADRLLDVLAAAHAQGIVHRDIKPENVLITRDARLKVLDFGLAQLAVVSTETLSSLGIGMGTPSFTAPEQARGEWDRVDARSDLYAVGATLFTMLSGRPPRENKVGTAALVAAMYEPAPSLAEVEPSLRGPVSQLVDRALSFEQSARFADARTMREAVAAAYRAVTGVPLSAAEWHAETDAIGPLTRRPSAMPDTPIAGASSPFADELSSYDAGPPVGPEYPLDSLTQPIVAVRPAEVQPVVSRRDLANGFLQRGLAKHQLRDLAGAISDYSRAIELVPVHAIAYFNRGVARQMQGELDEALLDYGKAIERQDRFADPYYNRACILFARGELDRAAQDASRALELFRSYGHTKAIQASATLLEDVRARRG